MEELLYDVTTLARIIIDNKMTITKTAKFLSDVWEYEKAFLYLGHRFNKKQFMFDVMDEVNYWQNKTIFDKEMIAVNCDFQSIGSNRQYTAEGVYNDLRSYFMELRLRMIFLDNQDYVRMKLRTLLHAHGYKRRTSDLMAYLKQCMYFYHIETYVRGGEPCDIEKITLDDMITFRVLENVRAVINPVTGANKHHINNNLPEVRFGNKVVTVILDSVEKHIVLTKGKLEIGNVRIEFGNRKFIVSLVDGQITEI